MAKSLEQLVIATRPGEPKALDLDSLTDRGMELALIALAAMVAAALIASLVQLFNLAWSAPLLGLPAALVVLALSPVISIAAAGAFVLAALIAGRWQRAEAQRGGVEAERGRARRGLRALTFGARERRRWRTAWVRDGRLALGETRGGQVTTVPFGWRDGVRAFIPGAPGSGKTVDLALHARAYIAHGQGVVAIDPKGDEALRAELESAAGQGGRRFVEWTPTGLTTYNPLARGNPSEITDKALAGEDWSEPHYLRQAQRYINAELQAMRAAGEWPASLRSLVHYLDPERLDALCDRLDGELGERTAAYVDSLSQRQRADLGGVRDRLAVLAESELGVQLNPRGEDHQLDLLAALSAGDVVYFCLDSDRYALASQMLGAAIISDLVSLTGELQGRPVRALVLIDEFAAVAAEEVSRLLSRSRSAGLSVVLATQAFADLSIARAGDGTDSLRRQVLSHIDYVVAHRQSEPEAAELLGQMAGTKPAWAVAISANPKPFWERSAFDFGREGQTRRRTREFVRHPDEFKRLRRGEAIVIEPAGREAADLVRIWPLAQRLSGSSANATAALATRGQDL
ncbi:MAG: type IV secretion system DNA-binding domain-containing protein [Solirubrobacterales bacterium]|nr:type IV secretion system DNA-binding domain-containing protein [Solirubrobacterales bacterium]